LVHFLATPFPSSLECLTVERLLPPRFLRGEKVAKPDEGGQIRGEFDHASSELYENAVDALVS
jgi:hypothetical protein